MTLWFIRAFFLLISGIVGYQIGLIAQSPFMGIAGGCMGAISIIAVESSLRRVSMRGLSSIVFGLLLGVFMAKLISDVFSLLPLGDVIHSILRVVFTLVLSYFGMVMAFRGKDEFNIIIPYVRFRRQDIKEGVILLDTSAIIDGRIADIFKTNFFGGRLVITRFVLKELQTIADSDDSLKRQKGRRGLEILKAMQSDPSTDIRVHEDELTGNEDVDMKLIRLAKMLEAKVCTTDFNLNRIAAIQGVEILNVNDLANAVKSVVFAGEEMEVRLLKEGKEPNQAVGYMEDGTMIVVSDARKYINQTVHATVTSVLQTSAGKMIFARMVKNTKDEPSGA